MQVTSPISSPITEDCSTSPNRLSVGNTTGYYSPPPELIDSGDTDTTEGRLIHVLRVAAQCKNATSILVAAVRQLYLYNIGATPSSENIAFALADLAVTGRNALKSYRTNPPTAQSLLQLASSDTPGPDGQPAQLPNPIQTTILIQCVGDIVGRVSSVFAALYGPAATRASNSPRARLNWIAVSGEDDPPQRPVNVLSAPFPQYDIDVPVPHYVNPTTSTQIVTTRYMIATSGALPTSYVTDPQFHIPLDGPPSLPKHGPVFLYIHGHMSRLEESLDLVDALHKLPLVQGLDAGAKVTVIAMDLPGMGYSTMVDNTLIETPGGPDANLTPFLDFVESFILHFIEALDPQFSLKSRLTAILGGSLGGNMGLRLSTKASTTPWGNVHWLKATSIVAWSPGSIWNSFQGTNDPTKNLAVGTARGYTQEPETISSRKDYFSTVFDNSLGILPPQPQMWYRDDWQPCKDNLITTTRLDRREVYNAIFRYWHWQIALEQLLFSFHDANEFGQPWYLIMTAYILLASGEKDNYYYADIYDATRDLAGKMSNTPGTTLFLLDTGHSIHNERPAELAAALSDFLFKTIHVNDYDGYKKNDLVVWRPSTGSWYFMNGSDGTQHVTQWGTLGDIPVPGDYDGDGMADLAVWRPGDGNWYLIHSSDGTQHTQQWGNLGDIPVPGDYDRDGKTDMAVWRPNEGKWYIVHSSDNSQHIQEWGTLGDIPVPGDYDGDGKTDMAVWRPGEGKWYIVYSSDNSQHTQQWGTGGDIPVPGDYDGDGKADIVIWRPSEGNWYLISSSDGSQHTQQWGTLGDAPVTWDYAAGSPVLTSSPASLDFGAIGIGDSSPELAVTLTNTGSASLTITTIGLSGADQKDFSQTNTNTKGVLAPGGSCTVTISFTASAPGLHTAFLTITDSGSRTPLEVSLKGEGIKQNLN